MPKHNKKYKQIIATSKELFWKFGIKRVTVEEICSQAHVSKMTFYKFFPNKIELAKIILKNEIIFFHSGLGAKNFFPMSNDFFQNSPSPPPPPMNI